MELKGTFPCGQCNRFYPGKKQLSKHIRNKHVAVVENDLVEERQDMVEGGNHIIIDEVGYIQIERQLEIDTVDGIAQHQVEEGNENLSNITETFVNNEDCRYINFVLKYISKPEIPRAYVVEMIKDLSKIC